MKLLVFAHVPPPLHGQSQMVQYLVEGLRADPSLGLEVIHVDARLSEGLEDVGTARSGKLPRLLRFCAQAIRARWQQGVTTLYYVPSPAKRAPLYRDWIAMTLLRPWFRHLVYHWHSVGMGEWLATQARPWERWLSHRLLGGVSLSIVLAEANRADAERLQPRRIAVVGNGVPDPCPDFATVLGPERVARFARRQAEGGEVRVLFMALCVRDKGVFDAVEAVALANRLGAEQAPPLKFRLTVGGTFPTPELEREFHQLVRDRGMAGCVEHVGFLNGAAKAAALRAADVFLFPTYYANEGQPLGVAEAMAHGLPVVTTRWRAIPEMLPAGSPGLVEPRQPAQAAAALVTVVQTADGRQHRAEFERKFTLGAYLRGTAQAVRSLER
jgi:glycosyltransferase involved in cell wall biosynthesis